MFFFPRTFFFSLSRFTCVFLFWLLFEIFSKSNDFRVVYFCLILFFVNPPLWRYTGTNQIETDFFLCFVVFDSRLHCQFFFEKGKQSCPPNRRKTCRWNLKKWVRFQSFISSKSFCVDFLVVVGCGIVGASLFLFLENQKNE